MKFIRIVVFLFFSLNATAFANESNSYLGFENSDQLQVNLETVVYVQGKAIGFFGNTKIEKVPSPQSIGGPIRIVKASISANEFTSSNKAALSLFKGKKYLNVLEFPEISVEDVIISADHTCEGDLIIKNLKNKIYCTWTSFDNGTSINVKAKFKLSDFKISRRAFLFNADDNADLNFRVLGIFK